MMAAHTMAGGTGRGPTDFSEFVATYNPMQSQGLAQSMYGGMGGGAPSQQQAAAWAALEDANLDDDFMRSALRGQFAAPVADYYTSRLPYMQAQWGVSPEMFGGEDFLSYMRGQYGV